MRTVCPLMVIYLLLYARWSLIPHGMCNELAKNKGCAGYFAYPFQNQEGNIGAGNLNDTYLVRRLQKQHCYRQYEHSFLERIHEVASTEMAQPLSS